MHVGVLQNLILELKQVLKNFTRLSKCIDVISVAASRTDMQDGNEAEVAKNNVKENPDFDLQLILSSPIPLDTNENISVKSSAGSIIE